MSGLAASEAVSVSGLDVSEAAFNVDSSGGKGTIKSSSTGRSKGGSGRFEGKELSEFSGLDE